MSEKIILNKENTENRDYAISKETERFEVHTKNLNDTANNIINSFKNSLITTQDQGLLPIEDLSEDCVFKEKAFINSAIDLLNQDLTKIDFWSNQTLELKKQIHDIIYQLNEERTSIDDRIRKMETPFISEIEVIKDIDMSKNIGRPILITGASGIGKRSLIYAFGVEYNHRIIRLHITKNTNINNLYFEIDQSSEHIIFGPLGHAVLELSKWQSKQDKINIFGSDNDFSDDPIPIIMIEGLENTNQETMERILGELEHDKMSFNIGNFDQNFASHVRPFIVVSHNNETESIPYHTFNQCLPVDIVFPEQEGLYDILKLHFQNTDSNTLEQIVHKLILHRENTKMSLRECMLIVKNIHTNNLDINALNIASIA